MSSEAASRPGALAFTGQGDLVVIEKNSFRIHLFREDGTPVRSIASCGKGQGSRCDRSDVCVGPDGSIFVLDAGHSGRVHVLDGGLGFVRSFECKGDGRFRYTVGIAVGAGGQILVADYHRHDVQVFDKEGRLLQTIGAGKDIDVNLYGAKGVCVDRQGRVFVPRSGGGFREIVMLSSVWLMPRTFRRGGELIST